MRQFFCRHRYWLATNAIYTDLPDDSISISWTQMMCERCGKMRYNGMLKVSESMILPIDDLVTEVTQ